MDERENGFREFGSFRLDPNKKVLWHDGRPVDIPLKDVELLCVLTAKSGEVVTKSELLDLVWSDAYVDESNLSRHVHSLRKAFRKCGGSEGLIQTVPRRGYRFTGEVGNGLNGGMIVERHSLTRTTIEEVSDAAVLPSNNSTRQTYRKSALFRSTAIAGLLVSLLAGLAFWKYYSANAGKGSAIRSIAVLPFKTVDPLSRDSHRGVGLADILITRLSGLKRIAVRPLSTVGNLEDSDLNAVSIGKQLGVDGVLEGTIYQTGTEVRVTVRFVSVNDGAAIWSGEFQKPLTDELLLQSEIALRVADGLSLNLDPAERRALTKRYTDNRDAYESYLRGRYFFDKRDPSLYPSAVAEFEHAIALDPNYALAFSGLADVYAMQASDTGGQRNEQDLAKANEALKSALALDDELAEAHTSLAVLKRGEWKWEESEREFKRAIELNPNYYNAHMWYSLLLLTLGRKDDALSEIERAKELAPLTPAVIANYHAVRFYRQDNDELLGIAEQEKKLGAREYQTVRTHSQTYLRLRQYQKVTELVNEFISRNNRRYNTLDADLAAAYALDGQMGKAEPLIRALREKAVSSTEAGYRLSVVLADLGRNDEAIELLDRCLETQDNRILWISVEPRFDRLRQDPRFRGILRKMNLPEM